MSEARKPAASKSGVKKKTPGKGKPSGNQGALHRLPTLTALSGGLYQPRSASGRQTPIVPAGNVAGRALIFVIAIMTFLSSLTLGAVILVNVTASAWQSQITRETTIQIRPGDGIDMEAALEKARSMALEFPGVSDARVVDREATARLLEPWLGSGLDIDELPVPRLVVVVIDEESPPDFTAMRAKMETEIPGLSIDDHRTWVGRLASMARSMVVLGFAILTLMLSATVLAIVFATRGAMAGNGHIIEVLHFVGAEAQFIASEFRQHFLLIGLKGAASGGFAAIAVFFAFNWWRESNRASPGADQVAALFGDFSIGTAGYAGVAIIMILIALLTGFTSHFTVIRHLGELDATAPARK